MSTKKTTKKIEKVEVKASFINSLFLDMFNTYTIKAKVKLEAINKLLKDFLNEIEFLKLYKDENIQSIDIESSVDLNNNSFLITVVQLIYDSNAGSPSNKKQIVGFTIKNIEEQEDDIFFDFTNHNYESNSYNINERIDVEKAKKYIAATLYLMLIEKRSGSSINLNMIQKALNGVI
jgi:hypothetical protein